MGLFIVFLELLFFGYLDVYTTFLNINQNMVEFGKHELIMMIIKLIRRQHILEFKHNKKTGIIVGNNITIFPEKDKKERIIGALTSEKILFTLYNMNEPVRSMSSVYTLMKDDSYFKGHYLSQDIISGEIKKKAYEMKKISKKEYRNIKKIYKETRS